MKSLFPLTLITIISFSISAIAQIGINTTNPTKDLDVNGEVRVRNLPLSTDKNISLLSTDGQGNLQRGNIFFLSDIVDVVANNRKVVTATGDQTGYVDLDLETTVVIPANKEAKVIVNYSVPVGTEISDNPPSTYAGVTFKKDGYERQSGSRKVTLPELSPSNMIAKMTTVSNLYTETFAPSPNDRTITYSLFGYIEQRDPSGSSHGYRFNMWSATGANYNWGKSSMITQVYIK